MKELCKTTLWSRKHNNTLNNQQNPGKGTTSFQCFFLSLTRSSINDKNVWQETSNIISTQMDLEIHNDNLLRQVNIFDLIWIWIQLKKTKTLYDLNLNSFKQETNKRFHLRSNQRQEHNTFKEPKTNSKQREQRKSELILIFSSDQQTKSGKKNGSF
jgi:hypothetical protein